MSGPKLSFVLAGISTETSEDRLDLRLDFDIRLFAVISSTLKSQYLTA